MFTCARATTTECVVKPAIAKLWLALRLQVKVALVGLHDLDDALTRLEAPRERLGSYESHVVRGGVVLRVAAVDRARQPSCRQVKSRRAQLPLVVPVGCERHHLGVLAQRVTGDRVDLAVLAAAACVGESARIPQQPEYQRVAHPRQARLIALQPGQ